MRHFFLLNMRGIIYSPKIIKSATENWYILIFAEFVEPFSIFQKCSVFRTVARDL
jgi:hypothetical protein